MLRISHLAGWALAVLALAAAPPIPHRAPAPQENAQLLAMHQAMHRAACAGDFTLAEQKTREQIRLWKQIAPLDWRVPMLQFEAQRWHALASLPGPVREKLGTAIHHQAQAEGLADRQQHVRAEQLDRQALALVRAAVGEEHPETALALGQVGLRLQEQGQHAAARSLHARALALRRKLLGETHPHTASSMGNLGVVLQDLGENGKAGPLLERALAIQQRNFGEEHPWTIILASNLGSNLAARGKHLEALTLEEHLLAIRQRIHGRQHSETADSHESVGIRLHALGRSSEARPHLEKALAIRLQTLGERHAETATAHNNLASVLARLRQLRLAQEHHEKALTIRLEVHGSDHPHVANSWNNLGSLLRARGKTTEARALLERALESYRRTLGDNHPRTADAYNNLSGVLLDLGEYATALSLAERVLRLREEQLGPDHPATGQACTNLGVMFDFQGQYARSESLHRRALTIVLRAFGEEHPESAAAYNNLGINLVDSGRPAEGAVFLEKALAIRLRLHGEKHADTAVCMNNLAQALMLDGQVERALVLFEKNLVLRRDIVGENHSAYATALHSLALCLKRLGQTERARTLCRKALTLRSKTLGPDHPQTIHAAKALVDLHDDLGEVASGLALAEKVVHRSRQSLGEDHPETAWAMVAHALLLWKDHRKAEALRRIQAALPALEAARYQLAGSGFDRAQATTGRYHPHLLLAAGLASLGQPRNAFAEFEAHLARGLLEDSTQVETRDHLVGMRSRLARLDTLLASLTSRRDLSDDELADRVRLAQQRQALASEMARRAAEVSRRDVLSLSEIQKQLPADSALVGWVDLGDLGGIWSCIVRQKGDPIWQLLPRVDDEDFRSLDQIMHRLEHPDKGKAWDDLNRRLSIVRRHLFDPIRPHLDARAGLPAVHRLLVITHSWTARVPVEVLQTGHVISYVPSGSAFARMQTRHRAVDGPLLALGDPEFRPATAQAPPPDVGLLIRRISPGSPAEKSGLLAGDVLIRAGDRKLLSPQDLSAVLTSRSTLARWREGEEASVLLPAGPPGIVLDPRPAPVAVRAWREATAVLVERSLPAPLPGTRHEVEALARLIPAKTVLLGAQASEDRLEELRSENKLTSFRILHFATHGEVDARVPDRSALLLARERLARSSSLSGRSLGELTVATIRRRWSLDADMVVLSACQTGVGKATVAEGQLGFAHAFLSRGARSVVLSRWKVDDTATALLMLRFYENLLGKHPGSKVRLGRAEALDEAKRWLRSLSRADVDRLGSGLTRGELRGTVTDLPATPLVKPARVPGERPFAHPFYWAAFVLVGDPD